MWHLLAAEYRYYSLLFLGIFGFVPLLALQAIHPVAEELSSLYFLFLLTAIAMINWNAFRNKERRDRHHALLPLSVSKIGLARISVIVTLGLGTFGLYSVILILFRAPVDYAIVLISYAFLLIGLSAYYIMRDLLLQSLRKLGFTAQRVLIGVMSLLLVLNVLGIVFWLRASATGKVPFPMGLLDAFLAFLRTADLGDVAVFMCVGLVLAGGSVVTFGRRNSYLE